MMLTQLWSYIHKIFKNKWLSIIRIKWKVLPRRVHSYTVFNYVLQSCDTCSSTSSTSSVSQVPLRAETVTRTARESQAWQVCLPQIPLPAMDRAPSFAPSAYELSSKGNESNPVTSYVSAAKAMVLPCNYDRCLLLDELVP